MVVLGNTTGQANPGKILINGSSRAVIVRDCDFYNPALVGLDNAGYSIDITASPYSGEIRFERCYVRSNQVTPLTLYGFFISGPAGLSVVQKDCSATSVQFGFYDTTTTPTSTGESLVWDSCVATFCNAGFTITDGGTGNPPTDKILLQCVASNNNNGFEIIDAFDVALRGCTAQFNAGSGFLVLADIATSNVFFEECLASFNGIDGFVIGGDGTATKTGFRFCTATGNGNIGFDCPLPNFVLIKDCLAAENTVQGILLNTGTKLDTRSGTCTGNGAADTITGTEINYCDPCL